MSDPICTMCGKDCDLVNFPMPNTPENPIAGMFDVYLSFCCRAEYRVPNLAEQIQRETLAELQIQRGRR